MKNLQQAILIANENLKKDYGNPEIRAQSVLEFQQGWLFFYNSGDVDEEGVCYNCTCFVKKSELEFGYCSFIPEFFPPEEKLPTISQKEFHSAAGY